MTDTRLGRGHRQRASPGPGEDVGAVSLTAWTFSHPVEAEDAEFKLKALQSDQLIPIQGAAVVSWGTHERRPVTRRLGTLTGVDAVGGGFWGLLFGVLLYVPLLGRAVGAPADGCAASLSDVGIDECFVRSVRDEVVPGSSALFLLASDAVIDRVHEGVSGTQVALLRTTMSTTQAAALRDIFGD